MFERTSELRMEIAQREQVQVEREQLLAELEAERARLAAVLEQMPAGVMIAEAETGRILLANEQMGHILRVPAITWSTVGEYAGGARSRRDGSPCAPEEWPLIRSMSTGEVVAGEELQVVRGDGTRGAISVSSAPIRDETGRIVK